MEPIWRDYYVTLTPATGETSVLYRITDTDGAVLFQGRAFPRPGESTCRVRLNDIVAPRLAALTSLPQLSDDFGQVEISVEVWDGSGWGEETGVDFWRDWSYAPAVNLDTDTLQRPVVPHVVTGQYLFFNNMDADPDTEMDMEMHGDTYVGVVASGPVSLDGLAYENVCARFVMYYLNALGGWDALPIEGKTDITDGVARVVAEQVYDNRTASARGTVDHRNTLKRQYTFHTQPLTAAQSLRMHHLLNSPHVYVHDLQEGRIDPLLLTGTATPHKDGHALYVYDITAQLAQERVRR